MTTIHETTVREIGPQAADFIGRGLFVTFSENAPEGLRAYSHVVDITPVADEITPGMTLHIGEGSYPITAVGRLVRENLARLGHVTVFLDGAPRANAQGAIHVRADQERPTLEVGTRLAVTSA